MSPSGQYQTLVAQPSGGGDLITAISKENVGASNYVTKLDWRRFADAEIRREGHVPFAPDAGDTSNIGVADKITLVHFARRANSQTAVIVGTQTTLYRYFSFEDGGVYTDDVYNPGVYANLAGEWLPIGENFSPNGNRWEAHDVAGKTIFNNGADLPVVYDLGWLEVRPLRELREQGIAFVGTISEFNGMLLLGDIAELSDSVLTTVMNGRNVSSMSQTGYAVASTVSTFSSADVGSTITWGTGQFAKIVQYVSGTVVNVDVYQTVPLGPANVAILYGTITDSSQYSRVQYRLLTSDVGDAENFGGGALVSGTAGSYSVTATQPIYSILPGATVTIPGAGVAGSAVEAVVISVDGYRQIFSLDTALTTTITNEFMQLSSRIGGASAAFDLQDNNSSILRIAELQGKVVVFKDDAIFVGQYTGNVTAILQFQKVYSGPSSVYWRWMLTKVDGVYLLYAGRSSFFTFELTSLTPRIHPKLTLCEDIFYDAATNASLTNSCWAVDNVVTREVWFTFPNSGAPKAICYDYQFNTCSTLGVTYSAAGSVKRPVPGVQVGATEDWFIMGDSVGDVYQYGLTNLAPGIWTRNGAEYGSTIKSGLIAAGDEFNEKDLRNYVLYLSKYPTTPIQVTLYGARNAHEPVQTLFTRTIVSPTYKNLIPTYYRKNYYQDELYVTGTMNASVVRRVLELASIDSRSTIRNNST